MSPTPESVASGDELLERIRGEADRLGLDRVAVADPRVRPPAEVLDAYLASGMHAHMAYLARHRDVRLDPARMLPGVASILCVALSYFTEAGDRLAREGAARVSRYALGRDYHRHLRGKLHRLLAFIQTLRPGTRGRVAVDTAPVLERHWAVASGLGWWGNHGCVIVPPWGSWVFLGEILLDLPLPAGLPRATRCGDCRRCLSACPTGALVAPGRLDARRCISYWTVEHRGPFTGQTPRLSPWAFGCDRCQEACPWNRHVAPGRAPDLAPVWPRMPRAPAGWLTLDAETFARRLGETPIERAGHAGMQRNARRLQEEQAPQGEP